MQRPVMNPMFMERIAGLPVPRSILRRFGSLLHLMVRFLLADVFFWRNRLRIEDGTAVSRVLHGMFYRILLAPLFIVPMVGALVYVGTHPQRPISSLDPRSQGSFYDPVNIVSADGTRLEGWIIPLLDARAVIDRRAEVLTARAPAVILVPDHEAGRAQMLPLVAPLHEAGMVVLILGTRGEPTASVGSTFGINESADVLAAVDMLRRRPGVDPRRIGILGVGTGANAAMLAAARDRNITALVLDHPMQEIGRA